MSGRTVSQYVLTCDGCGTEREMVTTAVEARGAAYADGWRFPARLTKKSGRVSTRSVFDLCAGCLPTFDTGTAEPASTP